MVQWAQLGYYATLTDMRHHVLTKFWLTAFQRAHRKGGNISSRIVLLLQLAQCSYASKVWVHTVDMWTLPSEKVIHFGKATSVYSTHCFYSLHLISGPCSTASLWFWRKSNTHRTRQDHSTKRWVSSWPTQHDERGGGVGLRWIFGKKRIQQSC